MSELRISELTKAFDDDLALDRVSLHARDGELLTLLGPSGCGKSTTLWSIAGLHRPDAGTIDIGGQLVFDAGGVFVPPEDRQCGMVFQSYAVWPHMTVAENVAYPLKLRRIRGAARAARVREVLDLVELGPLAGRYPHQLSGGQQQRVALARALAHPPRLLLLDEPFSNLDAKLRVRARAWLRSLQREVGVTTIFVTHDQDEALSLSDRIAVMSDGVVRQVGTPEDIYEHPRDLFVADFVGTVNLLDATVVADHGDTVEVRLDGTGRSLPAAKATSDVLRGCVTVAVRPEAILVDEHGGDDALTLPVVDRDYLGDHRRYHVRLGGAEVCVQTTRRITDPDITVTIPPGSLRAFPRQEPHDG